MDKKQHHINGMYRAICAYEKAKSRLTKKIFGKIVLWHFHKLESIDEFTSAIMFLRFCKTLMDVLGYGIKW